jgi:hypothetical protein
MRSQARNGPAKLIVPLIICLILPIIIIKMAVNYMALGIAILTPAPWNEDEERILREAIWHGQKPRDLRFILWRSESDIIAKARQLNLL